MQEFDSIEHALGAMRAGRPIVVVDGEDRENEGDLMRLMTNTPPQVRGTARLRARSRRACCPAGAAAAGERGLPAQQAGLGHLLAGSLQPEIAD